MRFVIITAIVSGILLVMSALYGRSRTLRAERTYPHAGSFVEVEGAKLHYVRKGTGPSILLLHGSDGFLEDYPDALIDLLAGRFDVIAMDRPGHGYSDGPIGEAALPVTQVRLILGALRELHVETAIWVAHSWGALLAMIAAIEQPDAVSGLVLLAPWIYPPASMPPVLLSVLRMPGIGWITAACVVPLIKEQLIRSTLRRAFSPDVVQPKFAEQAALLWLRRPRQILVFALESIFDRKELRKYSPKYADIRAPILAIVGDMDRIVTSAEHAERLRSARPATELIILPQTGHEIPHTRYCAVADAVIACSSMTVSGVTSAHAAAATAPRALARKLIFRFGWNATAYQILNPHMELWFTAAGDGVVGFVRRYGYRVVAGAPVCDESRLGDLLLEFEMSAQNLNERVCYFGAAARLQSALKNQVGYCELAIGAQPVWNPSGWRQIIARTSSLRAQLNRAKNKGVSVNEWPKERVEGNGALKMCLSEWLESRPLPTLHFLTEPVDLNDIEDRRVFVAETSEGVVGYLAAAPVPDRNGWLIEQIVRGKKASNGVAELLVDAVMLALVEGGYTYVTLGLSPLSRRDETPPMSGARSALAPALLLRWVRAHGRRFYNFDGLETFKAKFRPDAWEPITIISNEHRVSLQALHAVAAAFSVGPPIGSILRAMRMAVKQEVLWVVGGKREDGARWRRRDGGTGR